MVQVCMIRDGKIVKRKLDFPSLPRRGEIVSLADAKLPRYIVLRVEYIAGYDLINLHVKEFPNEVSAVIEIDGYRNTRFTSDD